MALPAVPGQPALAADINNVVEDARRSARAAAKATQLVDVFAAPLDSQVDVGIDRAETDGRLVARFKPNKNYAAGTPIINPSGELVKALVTFTTTSTYNAANWSAPASATYGLGAVAASTFGAVGDGVADDTAAIQSAIDSFDQRGGVVLLGVGTFKCSAPLVLGNTTILRGQGGLLKDQPTYGTPGTIQYRPQTILDFSGQACDGVITDPNSTYRCQGVRVERMLIRGSGAANSKSGVALYPAANALPATHRKVGLAHMTQLYIEHFSTGIDFSTSDGPQVVECHVSDVADCITGGGVEGFVTRSWFWRFSGAAWRIVNSGGISSARHRFFFNEVEPENPAATGVVWNNVTEGIIVANTFREGLHTAVELNGTSTGIVVGENTAKVQAYFLRCMTGAFISSLMAHDNYVIGMPGGTLVNAFDVRTTHDTALMTLTGNTVTGTFEAAARWDKAKQVWTAANRWGSYQIGTDPVRSTTRQVVSGPADVVSDQANPLAVIRDTTVTNGPVGVSQSVARTSGEMADGFGASLMLVTEDATSGRMEGARLRSVRSGADNSYDVYVDAMLAGVLTERLRILKGGGIRVSRADGQVGAAILSGLGSPNGAVVGDLGWIYQRMDGGAGTCLYVKESGAGTNTGWVGK